MTTKDKGITLPSISITGLPGTILEEGTVNMSASILTTITFASVQADANYKVYLQGNSSKTFWPSNKTLTTFDINASAVGSDDVSWFITAR